MEEDKVSDTTPPILDFPLPCLGSSDKVHKLYHRREMARICLTIIVLLAFIFVLWTKNNNESHLLKELDEFRNEDRIAQQKEKLVDACVGRYEDEVNFQKNRQLGVLSEFVVTIYLYPPNTPERQAGADEKIAELDQVNTAARKANEAKIEYDNAGHPLPCPIGPSEVPQTP